MPAPGNRPVPRAVLLGAAADARKPIGREMCRIDGQVPFLVPGVEASLLPPSAVAARSEAHIATDAVTASPGHDVHHPAERLSAVKGALCAAQDLDAFDTLQG